MDSFGAVRLLARQKHRAMRTASGGDATAAALLSAARADTELTVQALPPHMPQLSGGEGALHRASQAIYLSSDLSPETAAFVEAHEFGHYWIEAPTDTIIVSKNLDPASPEEATPLGLRRVEAYSPEELRERLANVFAREFLLPRDEARKLFITEGRSASTIAMALGLPIGLVYQQLAVSLLLPDVVQPASGESPAARPGLDSSQKDAAEHEGSPLLVEAGPGTGKTRTLVARVEWLIERGAPAPSILALTFSNKAAREIRERVALTLPHEAPEIWAGTFHAFGLEILRKYGELVGINEPIRMLDQADQLRLLEEDLPNLGLDYYLRLHEPLLELKHVLRAISRAKDEVRSPQEYMAAAERMMLSAHCEEDRIGAAKAAEVASVFRHYDDRLRQDGLVDFADLINRPIEILRAHPDVRDELRSQYQNLLVDEYQDINRASALLLKELAGEGERLWVVGDARQSIYRFRGAAPVNTRDFEKDYLNGARKSLAVNYRSREGVVEAFGGYAGAMDVGERKRVKLEAWRGSGPLAVDYHVARNRDAEIAGIAATIEHHRAAGIPYRDQAVLCRVHGNLERIASGLEALDVPVLYLGNLFERPEVRDLLALLSFAAEPHRGGLLRVATLPAYRTSLADVLRLLVHARERDQTPLAALQSIEVITDLSEPGRRSLSALRRDLVDVGYRTGPGTLLCRILFESGELLRPRLAEDGAADQQRRIAMHQLLQFAIENDYRSEGDPKRHLLDWVRRLEVLGEEGALREVPAAVERIDAVRLMTVHASKGLEFRVVHLPTLGAGLFPKSRQGDRCPLPHGLLPTTPADDHAQEEQCLFYVALSRARDCLSLSRAETYSEGRRSNPSEALQAISSHLPRPVIAGADWTASLPVSEARGIRVDLAVTAREHDGRDLELFIDCPRRYLYQVVLGLSGGRDDTGYVRFHRAVYRVLAWMADQGEIIDPTLTLAELECAWAEIGPHDHPLNDLYRDAANRILEHARVRPRAGIRFAATMRVTLDDDVVRVPIDEIEQTATGLVFRRLRTGRPPSKPDQRHLHALMLAAGQASEGAGVFEVHYLSTNEPRPVALERVMAARLADTRRALSGLHAGDFPAVRGDGCPRCPHYFICSSVPD